MTEAPTTPPRDTGYSPADSDEDDPISIILLPASPDDHISAGMHDHPWLRYSLHQWIEPILQKPPRPVDQSCSRHFHLP